MRLAALLAAIAAAVALAASVGAGASPDLTGACAKANLNLINEGKLTVGTDNPAFPPWFGGGVPKGSKWKINDPSTGKGFESAVAYAVAKQLGFAKGEVEWVYVPFARSYAPGRKSFDFDINQISYSRARAKVVTFSASYYDVNQAIVVNKGTPLIGASGSGKSTLLRCVNLLGTIDAGRILLGRAEISAEDADRNAVRRRIGIVFQAFNLFPHMSVRNVTLAPREVLGKGRAEAEAEAGELLGRFGLADKRDEYPDRLSGGQQQRVAIVRALAMRPELMLLDEVTSALDPELVAEVLEVIRELAAEGMTMLIATHEMAFARDIANRVCFLDQGAILEEGSPEGIFTAPGQARTKQFLDRILRAGRL